MRETKKTGQGVPEPEPPSLSDQYELPLTAEKGPAPADQFSNLSIEDPHLRGSTFNDRIFEVFLGPDGLRPIWRVFLYFAVSRCLFLLLNALLYYVQRFDVLQLWVAMGSEFVLLIAAMVPGLLIARIEGRQFGDYGLPPGNAFGRMFWIGGLWGVAALSVLMLTLYGAHAFAFGRLALHGFRVFKFAVFWGAFFLIVAFAEEFLLRGYSQFALTQATGFWPAAVLLSTAFGAIHLSNSREAWPGILAAACIGFFLCLTLRRTGTLWFAVGFHAAWDWGESYLYSVPDSGEILPGHLFRSSLHGPYWLSGGSVGPEGSVLIFVLLALLWIVFDRVYPQVKYAPGLPTE